MPHTPNVETLRLERCKTDATDTYRVVARGPARAGASVATLLQLWGFACIPRRRDSSAHAVTGTPPGPVPSQVEQPCQRKQYAGSRVAASLRLRIGIPARANFLAVIPRVAAMPSRGQAT